MPQHRPGIGLTVALAAVLAGCVAAAPSDPSPTATSPSPSLSTGFYLRAWTTQAIPPASAFATPARLVISGGRLFDAAVAIPAIYPGPLLVEPWVRTISPHGISAVIDALRAQGLLRTEDFTQGAAPGALIAHLDVVVDGTRHVLAGDPSRLLRCGSPARCMADPGTPEAFAAFWQQLTGDPEAWLGADLGAAAASTPERLAVLAVEPVDPGAGPIQPTVKAWPLAPFASFGVSYAGGRCGTVSGADLGAILPVLLESNQLTRFRDTAGESRSLVPRVLLPGEPEACAESSGPGASASPLPTDASPAASPGAPSSGAPSPGSSGGGSGNGLGVPTILGLACFGAGDVFTSAALEAPGGAENGMDAVAAALRSLIADTATTGNGLPKTGWRRVVDTGEHVLLLAPLGAEPGYASAAFTRDAATGTWRRDGYGWGCEPLAKLGAPFGVATWKLEGMTSPQDTSFTAAVSEMACASGESAASRLSDPLVVYSERTVSVTFGVVPPPGDAHTCQGNPPAPVVVQLREPLGDRELIDGAVYPPKPVEVVNPN